MAALDIKKHREQLQQLLSTYGVVLAYLFGSQAEGKAGPGTRVDFEITTLRRYVDTEPLRQLQDRRLLERAEEYRLASRPSTFRW